ncbi:MAG: hypothetical protein JWO11_2694 [Nocardioides sp.]|nr:hypothetical protein [Nocardioides sp.]
MRRFIAVIFVVLIAAAALSSCGAPELEQAKVEEQIVVKMKVDKASCPGGLKSEKGATMTCSTTTVDGQQQDVELIVTKVDGSTVEFDIKPVAS